MEINIWTVLIFISAMVYMGVAVWVFMIQTFESSVGVAFGWPGASIFQCLVAAALWPVLMPIGLIWALVDYIRDAE